ncbi:hypothetical protein G6F56_014209 [Rhizopus delemar]|nr:hypothetical protein G6F56_014209 [Rhizopus delemar]
MPSGAAGAAGAMASAATVARATVSRHRHTRAGSPSWRSHDAPHPRPAAGPGRRPERCRSDPGPGAAGCTPCRAAGPLCAAGRRGA